LRRHTQEPVHALDWELAAAPAVIVGIAACAAVMQGFKTTRARRGTAGALAEQPHMPALPPV
jgi:hypothetical protein